MIDDVQSYHLTIDESVGLYATMTLDDRIADYTGWTFKATFGASVADPHAITLNMAADDASEGFRVFDGPNRQVTIRILPATVQGYPDTSGDFTLFTNLLATPPGSDRFHAADITLNVIKGPTA